MEEFHGPRILDFLNLKNPVAGFEAFGALELSRLQSFQALNYLFLIFMKGNIEDIDNVSRFTVVHGPNTANYGENYESK